MRPQSQYRHSTSHKGAYYRTPGQNIKSKKAEKKANAIIQTGKPKREDEQARVNKYFMGAVLFAAGFVLASAIAFIKSENYPYKYPLLDTQLGQLSDDSPSNGCNINRI
tara:strand:+ start:269 stop:595 length:327 start_codon:yes stop_codon:yes gene_type:complete